MPTLSRTRREIYERLAVVEEKQTAQGATLDEIKSDVKSLLETRTFSRGLMKAVIVVATVISTVVTSIILFIKGH